MLRLILPLLLIAFSGFTEGVQLRKQFGEVRGNLRLEVITFPKKIAENFVRLNPQAIFYRPVKAEKKRNPLVIFLHQGRATGQQAGRQIGVLVRPVGPQHHEQARGI